MQSVIVLITGAVIALKCLSRINFVTTDREVTCISILVVLQIAVGYQLRTFDKILRDGIIKEALHENFADYFRILFTDQRG